MNVALIQLSHQSKRLPKTWLILELQLLINKFSSSTYLQSMFGCENINKLNKFI